MAENNYIPNMQNAPAVPAMRSDCVPQETEIKDVKLAHAYVPFQKLCRTFSPLESLKKGTAFPPLYDVYRWEKGEMEDFEDD